MNHLHYHNMLAIYEIDKTSLEKTLARYMVMGGLALITSSDSRGIRRHVAICA